MTTDMNDRLISGRYRIVATIGSGGMANVYKAYDEKEDRIVALKVLKQEHREDADFVRRFEREAQAVLSLSHDNIVRSYDVGEDEDVNYIVLEYVEGSTLKEIIQEDGPLTPREAVSVAAQVLDALEHAHASGIIHRDVKPQNVMITHEGVAKLTDFGIARDATATTRTFAGTNVIGSVHYLSPEQARGDQVSPQSDIYSCGIMLYEMLTGKVPFAGDNSVAIALKHLQENIKPPISVNSRIPRALSDVVVKASAKKPEQRYATAAAMREDLARALREPHGKFARLQPEGQDPKEAPKRARMSVGNIALSIVLVLGMFATLFFTVRAMRESRLIAKDDYVVPALAGKKLAEAKELAELRGFTLEVQDHMPSDEYQEGCVVSQTPLGATKGKAGDKISVVISSGSDHTVVPSLTGLTLQDALLALTEAELKLGEPNYIASDAPDGQIIKQNPEAETAMYKNDTVEVWVSGQQDMNIDMPKFTGLPLDTAVAEAAADGFERIWIYPVTAEDAQLGEEVICRQSPTAGLSVGKGTPLGLYVNRPFLGNYAADIAFNLDIDLPDLSVTVTAKLASGAEIVLYSATPPVGQQQSISFTGYLREAGEYECKAYVAGQEVRSSMVVFSKR